MTTRTIPVADMVVKYPPRYSAAVLDILLLIVLWIINIQFAKYAAENNQFLFHFVAVPLYALTTVKAFLIFHDCGHNNYMPNKTLNFILQLILSPFAITPPTWSDGHHLHHITSGHIGQNRYRFSDTIIHTKEEYQKMGPAMKMVYRIIRSPISFALLLPAANFWVYFRFPSSKDNFKNWIIILVHDLMLLSLLIIFHHFGLFLFFVESLYFAAMIGFMLFHSQHTFNDKSYIKRETWKYHDAALLGSSFLQVPFFLKWFFHGIEYHHLHHLSTKIPGYYLKQCHDEYENYFPMVRKVSMIEFIAQLNLVLYDEKSERFISFEEIDDSPSTSM